MKEELEKLKQEFNDRIDKILEKKDNYAKGGRLYEFEVGKWHIHKIYRKLIKVDL